MSESGITNGGALAGIRVLDLSRVLAGPWATQMLADMGAEVIKIEHPERGDDTRGWGPPFVKEADGGRGDAAYFLCANRGKTSRGVDFTTAEGRAEILALAEKADVVVENYRPGGLEKYGLDYASLSARNPGLVYCSITGFGQTGPYAGRSGYDFLIQGMGGLMSITGTPESGPLKVGVAVADLMTGMYAANAIVAALFHRQATGEGQYIDLALLDCQVAMLANQGSNYLVGGKVPTMLGNAHPNIVPYEAFPTRDGHIILAAGNDGQFARFCECAGHAEWAADPRFATNADRVGNRAELTPLIRDVMQQRSTDEWLAALEAVNVPCGPVNTIDQVFADPQVRHRGMLATLRRADGTDVPTIGNPIKFSKTPVRYERPPPRLDETD